MMDEIMLFFRETYPLYVLFTPLAVVSISVLLVMMMITPYDNEAAKYKEYINFGEGKRSVGDDSGLQYYGGA